MNTNSVHFYYFFYRTVTQIQNIETDDGVLTKGDPNPEMPPATDLVTKPLDEDGQPIPGATVNLECGEPPRRYSGKEQDDGTYVFNDAIPLSGREDCTLTIEAPG